MSKSQVLNLILQKCVCGAVILMLIVLGFLLWIIRSQGYEITTLRATCEADKADLDSMRKTIADLSLEKKMLALHAKKEKTTVTQYDKMMEEEKNIFGDSIMEIYHLLDESDSFVDDMINFDLHGDGYYNSKGYFKYSNKSIIYSDKWIISYRLNFDTAWGHGTTQVEVGTINRNLFLGSYYRFDNPGSASNSSFLSRRLKLSDIVSKDDIPRMTALLIEPFKNELKKRGWKYEIKEDGSMDTGFPMPKPTENFYYDQDGLHFVYNMYEIHCGAAGDFDLCIEWPLPESVVWGNRGAGTLELPEEWPIPPKIAPRPLDLDFYLQRSWRSDEDDLPDPAIPRGKPEEIINIREYPSQQNQKAD